MIVRKNIRSLSGDEKKAFIGGLLALKKKGRYDQYVHWHHHVMMPTVLPYEPADPQYRNGAHRGPNFLPWHREFLLQVESDLREIDPALFMPFWDWTQDAASSPTASVLFQDDFMGGNGVEADQWRVATGPFAHKNGNWPIPAYPDDDLPGEGLKRFFARIVPTLPTSEDVTTAMDEIFYDTPPYDRSPFTIGFRNRLEGWVTQRGDARVRFPSSQLHNRVHLWIGGNMVPMTSPDDPIFFLHHCFVDKIWADWQVKQKQENPDWAPHYAPIKGGPPGHNLDDVLTPWKRTIREVLEIEKLGYGYEQPKPLPAVQPFAAKAAFDAAAAVTETQTWRRSPFWAD